MCHLISQRFEVPKLSVVLPAVPAALCQCAVLLYSLHATLIAFWDTSRDERGENAPGQLRATCRLLECMKQVGLDLYQERGVCLMRN